MFLESVFFKGFPGANVQTKITTHLGLVHPSISTLTLRYCPCSIPWSWPSLTFNAPKSIALTGWSRQTNGRFQRQINVMDKIAFRSEMALCKNIRWCNERSIIYTTKNIDKQRVLMHGHQGCLMHGHQGWNVRHGLCHIYMIYVYIYELFIAFVSFVVCSLL